MKTGIVELYDVSGEVLVPAEYATHIIQLNHPCFQERLPFSLHHCHLISAYHSAHCEFCDVHAGGLGLASVVGAIPG